MSGLPGSEENPPPPIANTCPCAIGPSLCPPEAGVGRPDVVSGMRVLVLGAGFGGLELTTRLSEEFGDAADVVLVDKSDGFIFGFSKLEVMFGRAEPAHVHHSYADVV